MAYRVKLHTLGNAQYTVVPTQEEAFDTLNELLSAVLAKGFTIVWHVRKGEHITKVTLAHPKTHKMADISMQEVPDEQPDNA